MSKSRMKRINEQNCISEPEASSTESTAADSPMPGRLVNANLVNLRSTPEMVEWNILGTVDKLDKIGILETIGSFRKVVLSDGREGFIASKFCEVKP